MPNAIAELVLWRRLIAAAALCRAPAVLGRELFVAHLVDGILVLDIDLLDGHFPFPDQLPIVVVGDFHEMFTFQTNILLPDPCVTEWLPIIPAIPPVPVKIAPFGEPLKQY